MSVPLARGLVAALLLPCAVAAQRDCSRTSFGLTPLTDFAPNETYQGRAGGLYGGGQNFPPTLHSALGVAAASQVVPRDAAGAPAANGSIGMVSIGMSNTTQEFSTWVMWSDLDAERNPALVLVDGAQSGQDASRFVDPTSGAWSVVDQRVAAAGLTPQQVQVAFVKQALAMPPLTFPAHADALEAALVSIVQNLKARFPNLVQCFFTSRIYGGYSQREDRSEPLSYETAFAVREVITRQFQGDPALNSEAAAGPVVAPWVAWGPYIWADGETPRADGLRYLCDDYQQDGIHPAQPARLKVADRIDAFFRTSPFTTPWYLAPGNAWVAATLGYGHPCAGSEGQPLLQIGGAPTTGNASFSLGVGRALAGASAALLLTSARDDAYLSGRCHVWVDLAAPVATVPTTIAPSELAAVPLPVPADPALDGLRLYGQWVIVDPAGEPFAGVGLAWTRGVLVQIAD